MLPEAAAYPAPSGLLLHPASANLTSRDVSRRYLVIGILLKAK